MSYVALGFFSQDDVDQQAGDAVTRDATPYDIPVVFVDTPRSIAPPELPHTEPAGPFVPVTASPDQPDDGGSATPIPTAGGHTEPTPPRIWIDAPSTPTTPPATTPDTPPSTTPTAGGDTAVTPPGRWIAPRSRANDTGSLYDPTPGTGQIIAPPGAPTVAEVAASAGDAGASSKTWLLIAGALAAVYLLGGKHHA